jgi:hypothetical protein
MMESQAEAAYNELIQKTRRSDYWHLAPPF